MWARYYRRQKSPMTAGDGRLHVVRLHAWLELGFREKRVPYYFLSGGFDTMFLNISKMMLPSSSRDTLQCHD